MKYENRDELIVKAKELRESGLSYRKIADKLGVKSENTVRLWLDSDARERERAHSKLHYIDNKEKIDKKNREYYAAHREKCKAQSKEWYETHKEQHRKNGDAWARENPDRVKEMNARYRERNRDKVNERSRLWASSHKDQCAKNMRQWRAANPERNKENERNYRETHREESREKVRKYYANNQEKVKEYREKHKDEYLAHARLRKAKIKGYAKIKQEEYDALFEKQGGLCAYCGKPMLTNGSQSDQGYKTMDHIYPLSKGGVHTIKNIAFVCRGCNLSKHAKTLEEWRPDLVDKIGNGVCGRPNKGIEFIKLIEQMVYLLKEVKNERY